MRYKYLSFICCLLFSFPIFADEYSTIDWEKLMPKGWEPPADIFENIYDDYTEDEALMERMRKEWDKAPPNPDIVGKKIRIPGYVVPLEYNNNTTLKEFFLVPYFGACIHVPPPPANQMILVVLSKPRNFSSMDVVWVKGELQVKKTKSKDMGVATYMMEAVEVVPYEDK